MLASEQNIDQTLENIRVFHAPQFFSVREYKKVRKLQEQVLILQFC